MTELREHIDEPSGRVRVIIEQEEIGLKELKDSFQLHNLQNTEEEQNSFNPSKIPRKRVPIPSSKAKKRFDSVDYMLYKDNKFDYGYMEAENSSSSSEEKVKDVNQNNQQETQPSIPIIPIHRKKLLPNNNKKRLFDSGDYYLQKK